MDGRVKTFGKVAGGLGLLLLLTSPVTLFVTSGSYTFALGKASLGLLGLFTWLGSHWGDLRAQRAQAARSGFFYSSSVLFGALALGTAVAVNVIAAKRITPVDLTQKQIFSLSPQTRDAVEGLKDTATVWAFLPPNDPDYDRLEALLRRYASLSPKFTYAIKDPRKHPDLAQKYQLREGQPALIVTLGTEDNAPQTRLGIVSEEELTRALLRLSRVGTAKVYYVTGHGEWPLERPRSDRPPSPDDATGFNVAAKFALALQQDGYAPERLNLIEKGGIPKDAAAVIIAGAQSKLARGEVALLEAYLEQGGRVAIFAEGNADTGLAPLLAQYGLELDQGLVADDRINPKTPYVVVTPFFGDHESTRQLKQLEYNVQLPTVRGLTLLKEGTLGGVMATPTVITSPYAWEETELTDKPTLSNGEKSGSIPLVAVVTRPTDGATNKRSDQARLALFGDAQLLVDELWGFEPNVNLVMNTVAWAASQTQNITIRPSSRDHSTLKVSDATMGLIRFFAMDLMPVVFVACGLAIWLTRRSR